MRKSRKASIVVGSTVGALAIGGAAFAYWSTNGSGDGSAATSPGVTDGVTITQASLNQMFPGDSVQHIKLTATNESGESVYVKDVDGVLSVTSSDGACDATDFKVNDAALASDGAFSTTWSGVEIAAGEASEEQDVATIQFNDKGTLQDGCKNAVVAIAYTSN